MKLPRLFNKKQKRRSTIAPPLPASPPPPGATGITGIVGHSATAGSAPPLPDFFSSTADAELTAPVNGTNHALAPQAPIGSPPHILSPQPSPISPAAATKQSSSPQHEPRSREGVLLVTEIAKSYKRRTVVNGVSLGVRRGESVGLLGPNGAGKTTCFYMITGLVPPDSGRIFLDGHDVTSMPMYRRARLGIGYLPQEASIFRGLSVEDNIRAVLEIVEPDRKERNRQLDALLDEFKITHLRKSPSIALSGGERRRCEIARALASRPAFMLLDEPFAGIDPIAVGDIQDLVRHLTRRGIGVLITDHNVRETLGLIDRAYILAGGEVLTHGSPQEIIANPEVRRLYLGEQFTL